MERILKKTKDGSHTLYIPEMDEHYHSYNGAIQESQHIFIDLGLKACSKKEIKIFEVGFGTGLNAIMSLLQAPADTHIHYTSIEKYPIREEEYKFLNFHTELNCEKEQVLALHKAPWNEEVEITSNFTLLKLTGDLKDFESNNKFDLIYFDAFAPEKQPDLWTEAIFKKISEHSNPEAIITTYCAKGVVRRSLQSVGFTMERHPGPPGKRECLRGRMLENLND